MTISTKSDLKLLSKEIRKRILVTSHKAKVPHVGSSLSCVDILTLLYFSVLKIDPTYPRAEERDRFILSKGHGAPALFQVLALRGFYPESLLERYGEDGGIFAEHPPSPDRLPGIEAATGSLGHGFPMAIGMALAARIRKKSYRVYALLSDGECNEGSIWEGALFAAAQNLDNLCILIDFNKWQATGRSCEILSLEPLRKKWEAFGWETYEVDGHDLQALTRTLQLFPSIGKKPVAIIAHTVKGRGVSFMEDDNNWHYAIPTAEQLLIALQELS